MEKFFNRRTCALWAVLWGVIGFGFQLWLCKTGIDQKGLYLMDHPAAKLSFILLPPALLTFLLCAWPVRGSCNCRDTENEVGVCGIWGLSSAGVFLFCGIRGLCINTPDLTLLRDWGTVLCGLLVACASGLSLMKKKIPYGIYASIAISLIMYVVGNHRSWAAEPQVLVFFFPLMAAAFILLSAYQRTALAIGYGHRGQACFFHAGALFFSLLVLGQGDLFYGGMILWLIFQWWLYFDKESTCEAT